MKLTVDTSALPSPGTTPFEIVERKGIGHPDTLADALAEHFSVALSRYYLDRFGHILHHNVDKVLVLGGEARPKFGGGEVVKPIEVFIAGRATLSFKGVQVPVETLAIESSRDVFRQIFHTLDPIRHVKVHCLVRPGSEDLVELFERERSSGVWHANDSSIGVGFAPLSHLERQVLAIDRSLSDPSRRLQHPAYGEDTKLLAIRRHGKTEITVACAFCDRYVSSIADYSQKKAELAALFAPAAGPDTTIDAINAADAPERGSIYLTVTGTSAESGDDGQTGRGNRANGLITPGRPMTMEAVAGKNSVSHAGKLYNLVARAVAEAVILEMPEIRAAECYLVSRIGQPVREPRLAHVRVTPPPGAGVADYALRIEGIVQRHLGELDRLRQKLLDEALMIF
jgi:S-adenosylmethionine synthetase